MTQSVRSRAVRLVSNFLWNKRTAEQVVDDILALAAATGTAKTAKLAECEASQSGGEAVTPNPQGAALSHHKQEDRSNG